LKILEKDLIIKKTRFGLLIVNLIKRGEMLH